MKKFNILQLVYCLEMGGLENFVLNLIQEIDTTKYNVSVCTLKSGGILQRKIESLGVPVYAIQKSEGIDYSLTFKLARLFRKLNIDLIHTHNPAPWLYGCIAAKISGVKSIVHTEHSHLDISQKKLRTAECILSKFTDKIITDAYQVTRFLVDKQKICPAKIETILNGIDIDRFSQAGNVIEKKKELGISNDSLILGCVARLEPVKDHGTLLDSFSIISKRFPKAILILVGDGSQRESLEEKVLRLGIKRNVLFLGTRTDVSQLIQIFDIFVLSSISEGLSLALLEAMAAGKPIVATNVGGNSEIILNEETGFLVPVKDYRVLADKVSALLADSNKSLTMGKKAYERAKNYFNIRKMISGYQKIYDQCLSK